MAKENKKKSKEAKPAPVKEPVKEKDSSKAKKKIS